MRTVVSKFVLQRLVYSAILSALLALLCCEDTIAADHNRLHGCVKDASGRPVLDAKVVARRDRQTYMSNKQNWSADVQKTTGCYEINNLPEGTYSVHLFDRNYDYEGHLGPQQGFAEFGSNGSKEINLTTDVLGRFAEDVAVVFQAAAGGFSSLHDYQFTEVRNAFDNGGLPGWYSAHFSGFHTCATGQMNNPDANVAMYVCRLNDIKDVEFSKTTYNKISDLITGTLATKFPDFKAAPGNCKSVPNPRICVQRTEWRSHDVLGHLTLYQWRKDAFRIEFNASRVTINSR